MYCSLSATTTMTTEPESISYQSSFYIRFLHIIQHVKVFHSLDGVTDKVQILGHSVLINFWQWYEISFCIGRSKDRGRDTEREAWCVSV